MNISCIIGLQFGDEGKGKFTDYLSNQYDVIVRYQGGDNAGHSINLNGTKYHVRLIPSGVFNGKDVLIGNGVVLNPLTLISELSYLEKNNIKVNNLFISDKAHIIMPYHIQMDELNELVRDNKIGTTKRGIGPCYADKHDRVGIKVQDLYDQANLEKLITTALMHKNVLFAHHNLATFDAKALAQEYYTIGHTIKQYVVDSRTYLNNKVKENKNILLEGAQGAMLDIEFGTYPYVTSSSCLTGMMQGTGIAYNQITNTLGIVKAYLTRVGNGPMVTEIDDDIAQTIRINGNEFGTVTKRPRRIGWLDLPQLRYTISISGAKTIAITLLDVLTNIGDIKVCTHYEDKDGNKYQDYINNDAILENLKPIYKTFKGWSEDISEIKEFEQLPHSTKEYLKFIEKELDVTIEYVSVGSKREQTIKVK